MKSFYSLIKIAPNALSDDNLTIGIILSNVNDYRVKFSKTKTQLVKSIVDIEGNLVDFLISEIDKKVKETNSLLQKSNNDIFGYDNLINSEYFKYLSVYSNGVLKFSNPKYIGSNVSEKDFNKLFHLFVDSKEKPKMDSSIKKIEKEFYQRVDNQLIQKVKGRVHTKITLDSSIIPATSTFEFDCIGKNGTFVGAKAMPFTQTKETLLKNVNTYISVIAQLSAKYHQELLANKFFLIADEPVKKNSPEAKYWNQIRTNENIFKVILSTESGMVADIIDRNNAQMFI